MSEENRVFGEILIILLSCVWLSILIYPIFYKWIPLIWGYIVDKSNEHIKLFLRYLEEKLK